MPPPCLASSTREATYLGVGIGSLTCFIGYTGIASLAVPYYQMTLGVHPVLLGTALALPRLWEAFLDPVMGRFTDNFHSRWGRRRPFIFGAAIILGLVYGATWMVPPQWTESAKIGYFTAMSVLFFTAYTVYSVPYSALTYEIAEEYHERTRVMARCSFFHKLGEFGYQWIFPLSQLPLIAAWGGVRTVGWTVGFLLLTGAGMVPALFVRERFTATASRRHPVRFRESARAAASSRPYLILVALVLVNTAMGMLTTNLDPYVLVYYVSHGDIAAGTTWKALLSSGYAAVGIGAIPLVVWFSRRFGKRNTLAATYGLTIAGGLAKWLLFDPRHPWLVLLDPLLCGPIWIAAQVLFASMLADICDEDELVSGQRREGMFGAFYSWIQKSAVAASVLGWGLALSLAGFDQTRGAEQTPETFLRLRGLLVASTALPPLAALLLLRWYHLDASRAGQTRAALAERRHAMSTGAG